MEARVGAPVGATPPASPTEAGSKHILLTHSSVVLLRLETKCDPSPKPHCLACSLALHGSSGSSPALVIHLPFCGQRYQPLRLNLNRSSFMQPSMAPITLTKKSQPPPHLSASSACPAIFLCLLKVSSSCKGLPHLASLNATSSQKLFGPTPPPPPLHLQLCYSAPRSSRDVKPSLSRSL